METHATKTWRAALAFALAVAVLNPGFEVIAQTNTVNTIMLHDRGDISDAVPIYAAISELSRDADSCSRRTEVCICSFTSAVDRLSNAYHEAVARHPSWGQPNTGVEYRDPVGGGTQGIVISNARKQLNYCGRQ